METLRSWINPKRIFEPEGNGLIACTAPCSSGREANGIAVEWKDEIPRVETDSPFWKIPACMEASAPHQGEFTTFGVADEVAAMENPSEYGQRQPPRACTLMAARQGIRVLNAR